MKAAFIAFAVTDLLLMSAAALSGLRVVGDEWFVEHFSLGLTTTLVTLFCHCVVLAYFMATGKMIRLAVEDAGLDPGLFHRAMRYKMRAYAALMLGILLVLTAAFTGGWVSIEPAREGWHRAAAFICLGMQAIVMSFEYTLIWANGRLMDIVFELHHQRRPQGVSP